MSDGIFKRYTKIDFTGFFIKETQEDAKNVFHSMFEYFRWYITELASYTTF